jgi:hypothetical protein
VSSHGRVDEYHFRKSDPEKGTQFFAIYRSPDEVSVSRDDPPEVDNAPLDPADLEVIEGWFSADRVVTYRADSTLGREAEDLEQSAVESPSCHCEAPRCLCPPENGPEAEEISYWVQFQGVGLMVFGEKQSPETAEMLRANEAMYDRYHEAAFGRPFER